jgi:hypothetical protein
LALIFLFNLNWGKAWPVLLIFFAVGTLFGASPD